MILVYLVEAWEWNSGDFFLFRRSLSLVFEWTALARGVFDKLAFFLHSPAGLLVALINHRLFKGKNLLNISRIELLV